MNTRLNNTKHTSLNESIAYVNSPQRELDEAREYAAALEDLLLALCEGLDIDPDALVEDLQTPERAKEMRKKIQTARGKKTWARHERDENRHLSDLAGPGDPSFWHRQDARNAERRRATAERQQKTLSAQDAKEKASKKLYGRGGKVVEDIQTGEREEDMWYKRRDLQDKAERADDRANFNNNRKRQAELNKKARAAERAVDKHDRRDAMEKRSSKLYGKGGKVVKKGTVDRNPYRTAGW